MHPKVSPSANRWTLTIFYSKFPTRFITKINLFLFRLEFRVTEGSFIEKSESPVPYPRGDIDYEPLESPILNLVCGQLINGSCWYDGVNAELAIVGDNDVFENHAITLGMLNYTVRTRPGLAVTILTST